MNTKKLEIAGALDVGLVILMFENISLHGKIIMVTNINKKPKTKATILVGNKY